MPCNDWLESAHRNINDIDCSSSLNPNSAFPKRSRRQNLFNIQRLLGWRLHSISLACALHSCCCVAHVDPGLDMISTTGMHTLALTRLESAVDKNPIDILCKAKTKQKTK
ncbi:hypothetical protein PILCRDRAFT_570573 [Piloderma croceum F 1598]|uniref:Uncharacterized protein n=1 Tax=Piloderma croceum (strain F 1598) TaxID=765440 RepID=A0A0C3FH99_PILCF|nr:hypothetical protein PILCRDRAFT_570573 [Piloderma croceum F 1598]